MSNHKVIRVVPAWVFVATFATMLLVQLTIFLLDFHDHREKNEGDHTVNHCFHAYEQPELIFALIDEEERVQVQELCPEVFE